MRDFGNKDHGAYAFARATVVSAARVLGVRGSGAVSRPALVRSGYRYGLAAAFVSLGLAILGASEIEAAPPRSSGPLSLKSVVIAGSLRFALIEQDGVTVKRHLGDRVGAWTVRAIEPSGVRLDRSGATLDLAIFGSLPDGVASAAPGPAPALGRLIQPSAPWPSRRTDWEEAISDLLIVEGSAFNPDDPSRWGVKLATLRAHRLRRGRPAPELANLKRLTEREARRVYREDFIERFNLDAIPDPGLARQVFDATVHHGPGVGLAHLRDELGRLLTTSIAEKGPIGPHTVRAVEASMSLGLLVELRHRLVSRRKTFLHRLATKRPDIQGQLAALMRRAESFRP